MNEHFLPFLAAMLVLTACKPIAEVGTPLKLPGNSDRTVFAVSGVVENTMTNRSGKPVAGLILSEASLIRSSADLAESKKRTFVVFSDFLLGKGMAARYWEQQSKKQNEMGDPFVSTHLSRATIVILSSDKLVDTVQETKIAHAQLSVSTNDFERAYKPSQQSRQ